MNIPVVKSIFRRGQAWDAERLTATEQSKRVAWRVATGACMLAAILGIALASLAPFRRTVPYLVKVDNTTGNVEVLQAFDNRQLGRQELADKYWASTYVKSREQYNWWLVGGDYDFVNRLTNQEIVREYNAQFEGERALDKVFGESTERRINILSVTPAPTVLNQMVVRFERTTMSKGMAVEAPTLFVVTLSYRYVPKTFGAEVDLIRNPYGYEVYAYRRDVEQVRSVDPKATNPASGQEAAGSAATSAAVAPSVPAVQATGARP